MTLDDFLLQWRDGSERIPVHTSGSTGTPKRLLVEKRRMEASARLTCRFLGLRPGDTALLCLPLDYIAGKMVVVRSLVGGLRLLSVPPSSRPLSFLVSRPGTSAPPDFAAMIPMQVARSLEDPREREILRGIRHLIIGGGAVDPSLENALRDFPHAVWSTYGMTETLSHIALRRISGREASLWYTPFSHVSVALDGNGCLLVRAPEVCECTLHTHDIAVIHPDGRRFRILGRTDNTICSGGLKIQMEEVERRLAPFLPRPFLITKTPDALLGECVTLLTTDGDLEAVAAVCRLHLPGHWMPRRFFTLSALPLTKTGKPARREAERIAAARAEE